ncbi:MAG: hypothetical protein JNN13_10875 [Planctomycetes bacterium]|nr:hypothetical protein [Planctomycetota bacterium]
MGLAGEQPWFHTAVRLLDVRRQDRVLAVFVDLGQARDLAALVGSRGQLLLVLRDREEGERLAAIGLPQVQVIVRPLTGNERFGRFDALLVAPATGPLPPLGAFADLARDNLRPGGRFTIDVPGADMVPALRAAARDLGWDGERLQPLCGIADDTLAECLRNAGLRNVNGLLGAHLLHLAAPADLAAMFAPALGLDEAATRELAHALVRQNGGTGAMDVLVHRTRLQGQR